MCEMQNPLFVFRLLFVSAFVPLIKVQTLVYHIAPIHVSEAKEVCEVCEKSAQTVTVTEQQIHRGGNRLLSIY